LNKSILNPLKYHNCTCCCNPGKPAGMRTEILLKTHIFVQTYFVHFVEILIIY